MAYDIGSKTASWLRSSCLRVGHASVCVQPDEATTKRADLVVMYCAGAYSEEGRPLRGSAAATAQGAPSPSAVDAEAAAAAAGRLKALLPGRVDVLGRLKREKAGRRAALRHKLGPMSPEEINQ